MAIIYSNFNEQNGGNQLPQGGIPLSDGTGASKVSLVDANGNPVASGSGAPATTLAAPGIFRLEDGISNAVATVAQFHNADNQSPGGNAYGLLTGGVAQLLNASGNIDRQRETGNDGISAQGIVTGTAQLASPFTVTVASSITASVSAQSVTPNAMSGFNRGVAWSIQVGTVLNVDAGAANEKVVVIAVTATTFSTIFAKAHVGGFSSIGRVYNEARDASVVDGANGAGFAAGATYLLNNTLNSGTGGWEGERSAAGELDGASGSGTAVAAEYEFNGGGPLLGGIAGLFMFDRARSVQGKLLNSTTLAAGVAPGATSITLASVSALLPGMPILLRGGTQESVYVSASFTPSIGTNVVVALQAPVQLAHASGSAAIYDSFASNGPALNGFTAVGMGIEEEALYDPVSDLFYIERAATQDAMPPQNIVAEAAVAWNGTSFDRLRSDANATGVLRVSSGGALTVSSTSALQIIKASAGRIARVLITASGTTALPIYDNASAASGTIIGFVPANTAAGTIFDFSMPAALGIVANNSATSPVCTISFY